MPGSKYSHTGTRGQLRAAGHGFTISQFVFKLRKNDLTKKRPGLDIVIAAVHVNRSIRSSEIKRGTKNEGWKERERE